MEKVKTSNISFVGSACSEIIENLLSKTYEEENPFKNGFDMIVDVDCDELSDIKSDLTDTDNTLDNCLIDAGDHHPVIPRFNGNESNPFKELLAGDNFSYVHKNENSYISRSDLAICIPEIEDMPIDSLSIREEIKQKQEPTILQDQQHAIIQTYYATHCYRTAIEKINHQTMKQTVTTEIQTIPQGDFRQDSDTQSRIMLKSSMSGSLPLTPEKIQYNFGNMAGQGDNENVNYTFFGNGNNAISLKSHFSFYAKLLAILLTVNTLVFFKIIIWAHVIQLYLSK